jgi:hypothetical protein
MNILLQEKEVIDLALLPPHLSLKCLSGRLWITCQEDHQDHILKPGMEYRALKQGKVVIWALEESSLSVLSPARQTHAAVAGQLLQA